MEVVQHPYQTPNRQAISQDEGDFGPLGLSGLEQGNQFKESGEFSMILFIIRFLAELR